MQETKNIVELTTYEWFIDWSYPRKIKINLDEYVFFSCEYRCSDWHLIGHKYDKKTKEWTTKELSIHWCHEYDIANFIYKANKYAKSKDCQSCKVSRFNNLHYGGGFYKSLQTIFNMVSKMEENDK
jgi:hypothetical protein